MLQPTVIGLHTTFEHHDAFGPAVLHGTLQDARHAPEIGALTQESSTLAQSSAA